MTQESDRALMQEALEAQKRAKDNLEDWASYVPEFFLKKHGFSADMDDLDKSIANITARLSQPDAQPVEIPEGYPLKWKHATIHLNPDTGEMHSDGDHSVCHWIQARMSNSAPAVTPTEVEWDAARYRWLRKQPSATWSAIGWNTWNDDPAVFPFRDKEIDAAMKEQP